MTFQKIVQQAQNALEPFDYSEYKEETVAQLLILENEINENFRLADEITIETGYFYLTAKTKIKHKHWMQWVSKRTKFSHKSVNIMMQAARNIGQIPNGVYIRGRALQKLARNSVTKEQIAEIFNHAQNSNGKVTEKEAFLGTDAPIMIFHRWKNGELSVDSAVALAKTVLAEDNPEARDYVLSHEVSDFKVAAYLMEKVKDPDSDCIPSIEKNGGKFVYLNGDIVSLKDATERDASRYNQERYYQHREAAKQVQTESNTRPNEITVYNATIETARGELKVDIGGEVLPFEKGDRVEIVIRRM